MGVMMTEQIGNLTLLPTAVLLAIKTGLTNGYTIGM